MTTAAIRERLHDYIQVADEKKIEAIYTLLEGEMLPKYEWSEDEDFVAELDERVKRWKDGIDNAYTWGELEASIEQLKKERSAK